MDLVEEEDVSAPKVSEEAGERMGLDLRSDGAHEPASALPSDKRGEGGLSEACGSGKEDVARDFAAGSSRAHKDPDVLYGTILAYKVPERAGLRLRRKRQVADRRLRSRGLSRGSRRRRGRGRRRLGRRGLFGLRALQARSLASRPEKVSLPRGTPLETVLELPPRRGVDLGRKLSHGEGRLQRIGRRQGLRGIVPEK